MLHLPHDVAPGALLHLTDGYVHATEAAGRDVLEEELHETLGCHLPAVSCRLLWLPIGAVVDHSFG